MYKKTEPQKQRYLDSPNFRYDENAKVVIKYMFDGAAEVEEQEGMDLSLFNKPQVIRLLKSYNSRSKGYLRTVCNTFSDYYSWCLYEGYVDNTNVTNFYDYTIAKPIIDEVIPLQLIIDKYFIRKDIVRWENSIYDPVVKFILYAPFCGVYGNDAEDLIYLKIEDIDKVNKKTKLQSGKMIVVDDLFIELAENANKATEFYPDGFNRTDNSKKPNQYVYDTSCYILKSCGQMTTDDPVSKGIVMNRFRLIQQLLENKFITGSNLYKNGLINYVKEKFETHDISLKDGIFLEVEKGERQFAGNTYLYSNELQQYINEYGSNMSDRALRQQMKEIIGLFK